jgi:DNA modification methylase
MPRVQRTRSSCPKPAPEEATRWRSRIVGHGEEPPGGLIANPANWRVHPGEQQRALGGALSELGWVAAVMVNRRTGHLVDGHLRVELALARGEGAVPVTYVDLSVKEERLVLASLDPLAAMAGADAAKLEELLADLAPSDEAFRAMLADLAQQSGISGGGLTDPEAAPPLPTGPDVYVEQGDLWILGGHRLLVGDSTEPDDVARLFDGESATLMATDPPYLVDYDGGSHPQSWHNRSSVKDKHWDAYVDPAAGLAFFRSFLEAALPHLAPHVAIYQWHAHKRQALVEAAWRACGLLVHQQLIWVKARAVLTHSHFMWAHEPAFYGWVEGAPPLHKPPANATTVWAVDQIGESDGIHPTQKPVELFARPIAYHTRAGEICYDPFLGSGTSLIAAERAGRRCYGLEISPPYAQVCIERWQGFTGGKAVRVDG